jgi:hypothetical protein
MCDNHGRIQSLTPLAFLPYSLPAIHALGVSMFFHRSMVGFWLSVGSEGS